MRSFVSGRSLFEGDLEEVVVTNEQIQTLIEVLSEKKSNYLHFMQMYQITYCFSRKCCNLHGIRNIFNITSLIIIIIIIIILLLLLLLLLLLSFPFS